MFKYSMKDMSLVLLLLIQIFLLALPFFMSFETTSLIVFVLFNTLLMGTNYQCVAHNFIHLPFFRSKNMNYLFSALNTIGIGIPQSMYRIHHLNHHRYTNHPEKDESTTWRNGKEENIVTYSLLGLFRTDMESLAKRSLKHSKILYFEIFTLLAFWIFLVAINWKIFLLVLIPSYAGGQIFALWENYCEHYGSTLYDNKRDSVSCYNSIYNFIWFNNGYHQEHHFSPQTHWTNIPEVTKELPEDRVIVRFCHLTNCGL